MGELNRAARGGVGAVVIALGLIVLALSAGWTSGAMYEGRISAKGCGDACSSSVAAAEVAPPTTPTSAPEPTPTEPADFPYVSAGSIAVIDSACGALIYGREPHEQFPPASLTKLMTAAVAADRAELTTMITSDVDGAQLYDETGSTIMGLKPGMQLSLLDLLYGLMLPSGNDAAIAIAKGVAGSEEKFVELMNAKAAALALEDSYFTNPHGLDDEGLRSSAHDMAMLARYVMENPDLREIVRSVSWQPAWDGPPVWNGNRLLGDYEGADGVKIGYTEESQQTIVASATRGGRRIIAALLKSGDRYEDAKRVFDWGFDQPSPCP